METIVLTLIYFENFNDIESRNVFIVWYAISV